METESDEASSERLVELSYILDNNDGQITSETVTDLIKNESAENLCNLYASLREKAANKKREQEIAVSEFLCKNSRTLSLFEIEDDLFRVVAPDNEYCAYVQCLNPSDHVFDN